jgi:HlyD family secretion protein
MTSPNEQQPDNHPSVAILRREIRVIGRPAWWALAGIAAVAGGVVIWSFAGKLQTKVSGPCMLLSSEGVADIKAGATGRLSEVSVRSGAQVREGDVVAIIAQPDQDERIKRLRSRLQEIERRAESMGSLSSRGVALSNEAFARRVGYLERQIEVAQSRTEIERNQIQTARQLVEQKLATRRSLNDAERTLETTELSIESLRRQLVEVERERTELTRREAEERSQIELERSEAKRELALLEGERGRATEVRSAFSGRVVEVKAGRGTLVGIETPVVLLERSGGEAAMEVVMYVASKDGKKINPGAVAELLPATAQRDEHGDVLGRVSYISDYPATPQALLATLGSEELVKELTSVAAPFEVRIRLDKKDGKPVWTRSGNDAPDIRAGTLCSGKVTVRNERPIGFVIPALRKQTG